MSAQLLLVYSFILLIVADNNEFCGENCIEESIYASPGIDSRFTKFMHPAIKLKQISDDKGEGLVVNEDISIGTVLIVEDPWLHLSVYKDGNDKYPYFKTKLNYIQQIRNDKNLNKLFDETWVMNDKMCSLISSVNEKYKILDKTNDDYSTKINDLCRMETMSWGDGMYGLYGKLNYGYPTNIIQVGGKQYENKRIIVFASDNIKKGEELIYEYFDIFNHNNFNRAIDGYGIIFDNINELLNLRKKYFQKIDNILDGLDYDINFEIFAEDITKIYKNCITNTWTIPGFKCDENLNEESIKIKKELSFLMKSSKLFEYANGNTKPESWMGKPFIEMIENNNVLLELGS